MLACVNQFPQYSLEIREVDITPSDGQTPVEIELFVECKLVSERTAGNSKSKKGKVLKFRENTLIATVTSDLDYIDFRKIP